MIARPVLWLACVITLGSLAVAQPQNPSAQDIARWQREYLDRVGHMEDLFANQKYAELPPLLDEAADRMRKAELFLKDRRSRVELAFCWNTVGAMYEQVGRPEEGLKAVLRAEAVYDALIADGMIGNEGNKDAIRIGYTNPHHLNCLHTIGMMYLRFGEPEKAVAYVRRVADVESAAHELMRKKTGRDFPNSQLASRLEALGLVLYTCGRPKEAVAPFQRAEAILTELYADQKKRDALDGKATDRNPLARELASFSRDLASVRVNLCLSLASAGQQKEAEKALEGALAVYKADFPNNHPGVIQARDALALLKVRDKDWDGALAVYRETGVLLASVFQPKAFPDGNPETAANDESIGSVLLMAGRSADAVDPLRRSFDFYQRLLRQYAAAVSESEGLAYLRVLAGSRDMLLTALADVPNSDSAAYEVVWQAKGHLTRVLRGRQLAAVVRVSQDEKARIAWEKLIATRRQLAQLVNERTANADRRATAVAQLTRQKEALEREVASSFGTAAIPGPDPDPRKLIAALPVDAAFVDVVAYQSERPGAPAAKRYVAFILRNGDAVRRIDLGSAQDIDEAVRVWRKAIDEDADGGANALTKLVWEKVRKQIPAHVTTLYVCPEGALGLVPWWAFPGTKQGEVSLHDFTGGIAFVPDGQFLLEQLTQPPAAANEQPHVLAVGGVSYGPPASGQPKEWNDLDWSKPEIDHIRSLAGPRTVTLLDSERATAKRVSDALRTPGLTHVHLATHAQFDDTRFTADRDRASRALSVAALAPGPPQVLPPSPLRSPLAYTTFLLAGANAKPGDSYLSGDEVSALPLSGVRLAVLSACQTALGARVEWEGTFGLHRAWHVAGCRDVVATLWTVDDAATAALMAKFYHELWTNGRSPLKALREAQLTILSRPELIPIVGNPNLPAVIVGYPIVAGLAAGNRGPIAVDRPVKVGPTAAKSSTRLWAGFGLSGLGSDLPRMKK